MTHFGAMLLATVLWANIHWLPLLMQLGWASSAFILWLNLQREHEKARQILLWASLLSLTFPVLFFTSDFIFIKALGRSLDFPRDLFISWGLRFAGGILAILAWLRFAQPGVNQVLDRMKVGTKLERNTKTDVREIEKFLPKAVVFDPLKFVNQEKGLFLGLDEQKKPIYIGWPSDKSAPNIQAVGTTGGGKGAALGVMAAQFLERGEAVFFLDPKDDEWAPHVLCHIAQQTHKPFHFINLNRPAGPQFNPFLGATEEEAFELFQAGFSLTEKGDASDFYGIADRREAQATSKLMAAENLNIAQAYAARLDILNDPKIGAEKFAGRLRELAETPSINASSGGIDLAKVVEEGGCVYVVGSMRNDIVKTVQRVLLVRLIQLAERRDRIGGNLRPVCIVLDEVKYHLSRPALEGLGAARDKGVHIVLAHQSLGDLRDCTKDLNPDAVVDAVVENCAVKICYRVMNPVTAEWLAGMSGEIQADDEMRKVKRNIAQAEIVLGERNIRQVERYFIDTNMLLNLPKGVAVVYGAGLAKFVTIRHLPVPKSREAVQIHVVEGTEPFEAENAIDVPDNKSKFNSPAAAAIDI